MALNPPLNDMGDPLRVQGEVYILSRKGVDFQVNIEGMGKLKGKGRCILTTSRIILIKKHYEEGDAFKSFDLPLALMFDESFEQPIFGANYIKGTCKPLQPDSLPNDVKFKVWFMEGGCGRFLKSWRFCLKKLRDASMGGNAGMSLAQEVQSA
mmetsp:Transcript_15339/g.23620  ORF Transcript_15339/g.23620 Transcript_15339/m.23620 type:complete len:153 (+) Transcript_15339:17-475(+)